MTLALAHLLSLVRQALAPEPIRPGQQEAAMHFYTTCAAGSPAASKRRNASRDRAPDRARPPLANKKAERPGSRSAVIQGDEFHGRSKKHA